jgi:uncharacterized protein (TIGR02594 family)
MNLIPRDVLASAVSKPAEPAAPIQPSSEERWNALSAAEREDVLTAIGKSEKIVGRVSKWTWDKVTSKDKAAIEANWAKGDAEAKPEQKPSKPEAIDNLQGLSEKELVEERSKAYNDSDSQNEAVKARGVARTAAINAEYQRRADTMAANDPNIGRTWKYLRNARNADGVLEKRVENKTVIGIQHTSGDYQYVVKLDGIDRVDFERINNLDKKIAFEEDFAKPETQATIKKNQERAKQAEQNRVDDAAELNKYLDTLPLTPMQKGKIKAALDTGASYIGAEGQSYIGTRANTIFEKRQAAAGQKTEYRIQSPDRTFYITTKAEHDYAAWLVDQQKTTNTGQADKEAAAEDESYDYTPDLTKYADTIPQIRKSDIDRIVADAIDQGPEYQAGLLGFLRDQRPDLADRIDEALAESLTEESTDDQGSDNEAVDGSRVSDELRAEESRSNSNSLSTQTLPGIGGARPIGDLIGYREAQSISEVPGLIDSEDVVVDDGLSVTHLTVNTEVVQGLLDARDAALGLTLPGVESKPTLEDDLVVVPYDRESDQDDVLSGSFEVRLVRHPKLRITLYAVSLDDDQQPVVAPPGTVLVYSETENRLSNTNGLLLYSLNDDTNTTLASKDLVLFDLIDGIEQANAQLVKAAEQLESRSDQLSNQSEQYLADYFAGDQPKAPVSVIRDAQGRILYWSVGRYQAKKHLELHDNLPEYHQATTELITQKQWRAQQAEQARPPVVEAAPVIPPDAPTEWVSPSGHTFQVAELDAGNNPNHLVEVWVKAPKGKQFKKMGVSGSYEGMADYIQTIIATDYNQSPSGAPDAVAIKPTAPTSLSAGLDAKETAKRYGLPPDYYQLEAASFGNAGKHTVNIKYKSEDTVWSEQEFDRVYKANNMDYYAPVVKAARARMLADQAVDEDRARKYAKTLPKDGESWQEFYLSQSKDKMIDQATYEKALADYARLKEGLPKKENELRNMRRGTKAYKKAYDDVQYDHRLIDHSDKIITQYELELAATDPALPEWKQITAAMRLWTYLHNRTAHTYFSTTILPEPYLNALTRLAQDVVPEADQDVITNVARWLIQNNVSPSFDFVRTLLRPETGWENSRFDEVVREGVLIKEITPFKEKALAEIDALGFKGLDGPNSIRHLRIDIENLPTKAASENMPLAKAKDELNRLIEEASVEKDKYEAELLAERAKAEQKQQEYRAAQAALIAQWEQPLPEKVRDENGKLVQPLIEYVENAGPIRLQPIPKTIKQEQSPVAALKGSVSDKDDIRVYLSYVYADADFITATNGHQMVVTPNNGRLEPGFYDQKTGQRVDTDWKYPDFKRILNPDRRANRIIKDVSLDQLIAIAVAAEQADKISGDKENRYGTERLVPRKSNEGFPLEIIFDDFSNTFSSKVMIKSLTGLKKASGASTVTISIYDESKLSSVKLETTDGSAAVVMPLRTNKGATHVPVDLATLIDQKAAPAPTVPTKQGKTTPARPQPSITPEQQAAAQIELTALPEVANETALENAPALVAVAKAEREVAPDFETFANRLSGRFGTLGNKARAWARALWNFIGKTLVLLASINMVTPSQIQSIDQVTAKEMLVAHLTTIETPRIAAIEVALADPKVVFASRVVQQAMIPVTPIPQAAPQPTVSESASTTAVSVFQKSIDALKANGELVKGSQKDTDQQWQQQADDARAKAASGQPLSPIEAAFVLYGQQEGNNAEIQKVLDYFGSKLTQDQYPWCAPFLSYIHAQAGIPLRIQSARAFLKKGQSIQADQAQVGDILVMRNTNEKTGGWNGWGGHVVMIVKKEGDVFWGLGGNQNDEVNVTMFHKDRVLGIRRIETKPAQPMLAQNQRNQARPQFSIAAELDAPVLSSARALGASKPNLTPLQVLDMADAGEAVSVDEFAILQAYLSGVFAQTPALGVDSPSFKKWFGRSKMVSKKTGQPIKMYHATSADFTVFDLERSGKGTSHPTAAMGFFFSNDKGHAATKYGDNVMEVYLAIERPYLMTDADLRQIDGIEEAKAFREKLIAQGYDGIAMPAETSTRYVAAFYPDQIKLTNNETYTRGVDDIRYSRGSNTAPGLTQSGFVSALKRAFPYLSEALDKVLARGLRGEKGGTVLIDSNDPNEIARVYAEKTGRSFEDALKEIQASVRGLDELLKQAKYFGLTPGAKWNGVGKEMGGIIYVHRQYLNRAPQAVQNQIKAAEKHIPADFSYTHLKFNPKTGEVGFQLSRDFDTANEPTVNVSYLVKPDGSVTRTPRSGESDQQIWHHKWMWVDQGYPGFDYAESVQRSIDWNMAIERNKDALLEKTKGAAVHSKIGSKAFWESEIVPLVQSTWGVDLEQELPATWELLSTLGYKPENASNTQIANTRKTYVKVAADNIAKTDKVLDYSAGLGYGTADMRAAGWNVDDYEPFSNPNSRDHAPMFDRLDATDIPNDHYDTVLNQFVLNVVPEETRRVILSSIYQKVKPGGKAIILVRGWSRDVDQALKQGIVVGPEEILTSKRTFQKGFTYDSLTALVKQVLPGAEIVGKPKSNALGIVIRKPAAPPQQAQLRFSKATGKMQGFYDPRSGLIFAILPNLSAQSAPAVFLHETGHGQQRDDITKRAVDIINQRNAANGQNSGPF